MELVNEEAPVIDGAAGLMIRKKRNHRKLAFLPQRPKRAATGFSIYLKEYFEQHKPANSIEARNIMTQASAGWNGLPADVKRTYEQLCAEDKARYAEEIAKWKIQRATLKRPASSYAMFLKETWERERDSGRSILDMSLHIAALWKEMGNDEKAVYKRRYEEQCQEHRNTMEQLKTGKLAIEAIGRAPVLAAPVVAAAVAAPVAAAGDAPPDFQAALARGVEEAILELAEISDEE